jgi:hydroxymethylbilane synthase
VALIEEQLIKNSNNVSVKTVIIKTSGDAKQTLGEKVLRDKKDWILELEKSLLDEEIDFALHSGKDIPVDISEKTVLMPLSVREVAQDCLIVKRNSRFKLFRDLPEGCVIGTSSLRRAAQIKHVRPDIKVVTCRGNIATRLERLETGSEMDAIVLAYAGIKRLGLENRVAEILSIEQFVPAVNQGLLVAQYRKNDMRIASQIEAIKHIETAAAFLAEREVVACLKADCHSALGVYAENIGEQIKIVAQVFSSDGAELIKESIIGDATCATNLGRELASNLILKGAKRLLETPFLHS